MEQLKHTPGPWHVIEGWDEKGNGKYFPSVVLSGPLDDKSGRRRITINVSHDQEIPSLMANAKLISAAPDLLQACIDVLSYLANSNHRQYERETLIRAIDKATK